MAITIHGSASSTCTRRILTTCLELDIPYSLHTVDFAKAEHKSLPFLKLQPWGKVPVLEDDGFFVFESRAICKYLVAKYGAQGSTLMPDIKDLKSYALFEQGCSIEQNYFNAPVEGLAYEKVFKGYHGRGPADEAVVSKYAAELDSALKVYDGILAKQKYLGGDQFTLVDVYHLPYGQMVYDLGYKETFEKYANVRAWWESITGRESWKNVAAGKV